MAKSDTKQAETEQKPKTSFFKDERVRFTIGVLVVFFSIYLAVAFISYLFTWKVDQSFEWQTVFSDSSVVVDNWAGKIGALFASQFMNRWFGLPSMVFPFIIFLFGINFFKIKLMPLWKSTFKIILGVLVFSLTLGFLFGAAGGILGSGLGGAHGLFVSQWLNAFIGKIGTAFIVLLLVIAYLIYINKNTLYWLDRFFYFALMYFISLFKRKPKPATDEILDTLESEGVSNQAVENKGESDEKKEPEKKARKVSESETIAPDPFKEDALFQVNNTPISEDIFTVNNTVEPSVELETEKEPNSETIVITDNSDGVELTVEVHHEKEFEGEIIDENDFYDPTLDLSSYQRPPLELLEDYKSRQAPVSEEELHSNKNKIVETLANYKIEIARIVATVGPTVTLYEIVPAPGVRISKIKSLEDDIALSLSALGIRIIAPIPGRGTIGIEVPNQKPEVVSMFSILRSAKFQESKFDLALALGKTISNETFVIDLAKMPHLLVAGATGQGKSVGLNAIVASLLYKKHPAQLKFVLVDPKKVELTLYTKLEKHFLAKLPDTEEAIITDTQKVINTLNSLCIEMDSRYDLLKAAHVRNIKEYNEKFTARRLNPNKGHKFLPYIVVIIDEFADLIMTAGREIETPIARLAQLARAIGIHLIIATQRPTTNIITGVIKANFPARIAFRVSSMIDSRTILDTPGANQLIGRGDMLISTGNDLVRVQCAFIDTPEIERLTDFIGNQQGYASAFMLPEYTGDTAEDTITVDLQKRDDLFEDAALLIVQHQQGSTSLIQRKFAIGYNRAGRIMDQLEAAGIVGQSEGSKARQVLIMDEVSLTKIFTSLNDIK
jgi:S-DNA-T family DNA segregation ATPase FtsK/SpoIIIE